MAITKLAVPQGPGVTVQKLANSLQVHLDTLVNQINRQTQTTATVTLTKTVGGQGPQGQIFLGIPNPITVPTFLTVPGTGGTTSFTSLATQGIVQGYIVGTVTTTLLALGSDTTSHLEDLVLGNGTSTTNIVIAYNTLAVNEPTFKLSLGSGTAGGLLQIAYNTLTSSSPTFLAVFSNGASSLKFAAGTLIDNTGTGTFNLAGTGTINHLTVTNVTINGGTATYSGVVVNGTASIASLVLSTGIPESSVVSLVSDLNAINLGLAGKTSFFHTHSYTYVNGTATTTSNTGTAT
jgi:hypothetical protein